MKKSIALIFAASTLILAGCCTMHQSTIWEYKTVSSDNAVNQLASQGWILVEIVPLAGKPQPLLYVMKHPKQ